ncbi:diacylglycerol kinase [Paraneptunicella aestuarii]|uniref:diacylglycerol kinase n=1 Tax=Paraneptunicella aestuarii TaxID=2831148 RepID=UPI001E5FFA2A|nr:diacylglycerol kinase [Paraneptunicella aestuarii]UAA39324.1 diacylglycerol kinase [Paraneptunicella aestuarii]
MTHFEKRTGLKRLLGTIINAWKGFRWMLCNEEAFQQELLLAVPLTLLALWLDVPVMSKLALIGVLFLVLLVEVLNTAIETAIDRIGTELHELSGLAKDIASFAVTLSLILACIVWATILWDYWAG